MFRSKLAGLIGVSMFFSSLANAGIEEYKTKLAEIAPKYLHDMRSEVWKELYPLIDQSVLDDAHSKASEFQKLFDPSGLKLIPRKVKTMKRVGKKMTGPQPDIAYKVNSDFSAFRIHVEDPNAIPSVVKVIEEVARAYGGYTYIRNSIQENGRMIDIVQYLFVYIPSIGYVTEMQVGHPFTSYTFTLDSLIRDRKNEGLPVDDIVDLWMHPEGTDWTECFYLKMRNKILNPSIEFDVLGEWKKIFGDRKMDDHLYSILKNYI